MPNNSVEPRRLAFVEYQKHRARRKAERYQPMNVAIAEVLLANGPKMIQGVTCYVSPPGFRSPVGLPIYIVGQVLDESRGHRRSSRAAMPNTAHPPALKRRTPNGSIR